MFKLHALRNIDLAATLIVASLAVFAMAADQSQSQGSSSTQSQPPPGGPMWGRGHMMGPGMMGPGMMGGYGMGPGMMGAWQALDLNDKQREQLAQLQRDLTKTQLDLQSKMADEYARLQELYAAEKPDTAAISQVYGTIADLQRQMVQANNDANNRMQAALTEAQRNQLQRWQRGMMMGPMMMGPRYW